MAVKVHTKGAGPSPLMSSPTNPVATVASAAPRAAAAAAPAAAPMSTPVLLAAMLRTSAKISDLFFSPGKPPLVEINGKLVPAGAARSLTCEDTRRIAADLMGDNQDAAENLRKLGSCDVSYSLPGSNRFRVNIFMQRGTCAVVMRVIPGKVPDFESLNLHADTPSFALALRAALRQAPKVILVGEMRDRETIEIAMEAAETGHLVLSTLHTIDASKTIERIVGSFPLSDQQAIRTRFSKAFRFVISQRLLPRADGKGRVAVLEILKSSLRTREY